MEQIIVSVACLLAGLFSIVCSIKEYGWFMEHRKARAVSAVLGRNGARAFYIILGGILVVAGIAFLITPNLR